VARVDLRVGYDQASLVADALSRKMTVELAALRISQP
jgi:hypothetical protein